MKYSLTPFEKEFISRFNLKNEVVVIDAKKIFKNQEIFDTLNSEKFGDSDKGLFVTISIDDNPYYGVIFQKDPANTNKNIKLQISSTYHEDIPVEDYVAIFELELFKKLDIDVESAPLNKESFICYFSNDTKISDYNFISREFSIETAIIDENEIKETDTDGEDEEFFDDTTEWEDTDEDLDEKEESPSDIESHEDNYGEDE